MPVKDAARPEIVFATFRYPPSVGGMQTLAASVVSVIEERADVRVVALGRRSKVHVLWFFPWALVRVASALRRRPRPYVVCGDALTYAVLWPVLAVTRSRAAVIVHGLDLLFAGGAYRWWLRRALRHAGRVIANSTATAAVAHEAGARPERLVVVNPGVDDPPPEPPDVRAELRRLLGLRADASVLVTLGRLVPRKGVDWFAAEVMPRLGDATYAVAGRGPHQGAVGAAAEAAGVADRVRLLGGVDERTRELLLRGADVVVMPNVPRPRDMEGFGLVAVEAAMRGTVVVAARCEGITDAVADGVTGVLCPPADADAFAAAIRRLLDDPAARTELGTRAATEAARRYSIERFAGELAAALGLD